MSQSYDRGLQRQRCKKNYNATSILVRFENKYFLLTAKKRSSLLQRWRCNCKFKIRGIGSRGKRSPLGSGLGNSL
jgi:hypothetical protein